MSSPASDQFKAVIFDLFGVIVAFDDRLVYDRISQRCAEPADAAERMLNLVSEPNLIRGHTSLQQLHERLATELKLSASLEEFETMWLAPYSEPMPGMRDVLTQLAGQCKLVLLSNVDPYYWPVIEANVPELQHFHAKVLSFQQGVAKPEKRAFELAVAASGVAVDRCYFVDDKPENIEAAAETGLTGHFFQNCRMLKIALREAGLHVE